MKKLLIPIACSLAMVAALCGNAAAQAFPDKPIRLIVPFPAGGGVDITARLLAKEMQPLLGQPLIVENISGASTMIATKTVVKAAPDGYTLLVGDGAMAIHPFLYKNMDYQWEKDLTPISLLVKVPNVLTVNADLPIRNTAELIDYARAHPIAYSSSGVGNANHLSGELFAKLTGAKLAHVPYRGVAPQLADAAAGHVAMTFASIGASKGFIEQGRLRAIAVSGTTRVSALPDVPALAETPMLSTFDISNYFGLFGPAKMPAPVLEKINAAVIKALANPEVAKRLKDLGFEPAGNTPEQFRAFITGESAKYHRIVLDSKIKLEE